ncbi:MAG: DNA gyrase inhibitor YacG [Methylococcaceae bacterium]|nr:DNA gyrase inhibitor YacG [Methylococcaceae bacterium]
MDPHKKPLTVKCPTCQQAVAWIPEQAFKPFCSERCKLIDLGEWVMEAKRIPGDSINLDDPLDEDSFFQ